MAGASDLLSNSRMLCKSQDRDRAPLCDSPGHCYALAIVVGSVCSVTSAVSAVVLVVVLRIVLAVVLVVVLSVVLAVVLVVVLSVVLIVIGHHIPPDKH